MNWFCFFVYSSISTSSSAKVSFASFFPPFPDSSRFASAFSSDSRDRVNLWNGSAESRGGLYWCFRMCWMLFEVASDV